MNPAIVFLLLLGTSLVRVPDKTQVPVLRTNHVWVFFTDKGVFSEADYLRARSAVAAQAAPDVAARRGRELIGGFDFDDLPVREQYVRAIEALGGRRRTVSNWLNAASFILPASVVPAVYALPFVYDVKAVGVHAADGVPTFPLARFEPLDSRRADTAEYRRFYGSSFDQAQMMGVPEVAFRGFSGANVKLALFDTGLKLRNRAVARLRIHKQHDFLSGDNFFSARSDNWQPGQIDNLRYLGLVRDPALTTVNGSIDTCLLAFVADSFAYGYNPPVRVIFTCHTTDAGRTWSDPTPIVRSRPFDNTCENLNFATNRFTSYLVYDELAPAGADASANVYLGWYIGTDWYGTSMYLGSGRFPGIAVAGDTLYVTAVRAESLLVLWKASIVMPAPEPLLANVFSAGEPVAYPQVAVGPGGSIDIVANGYKSGRLLQFSSTDGGVSFGPGRELAAVGARACRLTQNGDNLSLYYKNESENGLVRLALLVSRDRGQNWAQAGLVAESTLSVGSFSPRQDQAGRLSVLYETGGLLYRAQSTDDGVSWSRTGPLDTAGFCYMPALVGTGQSELAVWFKRGDDNTVWEDSDTAKFSPQQPDHGTRMASIIAGWQQGGLVGIAPGVDLIVAKTELYKVRSNRFYEYNMEEDTYIEALEWAERIGADIVSSSLGYRGWYSPSQLDGKTALVSIAADLAARRGVVVVTAMGNRDTTVNPWPGPYIVTPGDAENVITVGGVQKNLTPWRHTGTGPTADGRTKPDLVALCDTVAVVAPDSLDWLDGAVGTSCATALVAGVCALVKEVRPQWSAESVKAVLFATATRSVKSCTFGYGVPRVDSVYRLYPPGPETPDIVGDGIGTIFPNPFVPTEHNRVYFPINLTRPVTDAKLRVYSSSGVMVYESVLNGAVLSRPGRYGASGDKATLEAAGAFWDGRNQAGKPVAAGLYAAVLHTTFHRHVARFVLVR